jgi:hypothetical protein
MASVDNNPVDEAAPPDEWLALSDAERAEVQRRAADYDPDQMEAAQWVEVREATDSTPQSREESCEPTPPPTPEEAVRLLESLEPDYRMRLIGRLWLSLPPEQQAAIITRGLEELQNPSYGTVDALEKGPPPEPFLWRVFFDPANTSDLYSAPRRFDLATIFVVTAAYSLLFGGLSGLDNAFNFGPLPLIVLGSLIAIVGLAQALCHGVLNPRGVSIVAGAAAYSLFSLVLFVADPRLFLYSPFVALVINGFVGGAVLGYMAGVLVGGVFLAADALRGKFDRIRRVPAEDLSETAAD